MSPRSLNQWSAELRLMLDDDLVTCKQAALDVVNAKLDVLELALLREAVQPVTQTITINVQAAGGAQLAPEIAQALSTSRSSRRPSRAASRIWTLSETHRTAHTKLLPIENFMGTTRRPRKRAKRRSRARSMQDTALMVARYALSAALVGLAAAVVTSAGNVAAAWLSHPH